MKNKLITIMFITYILVFSIGSIIVKDRVFSDMESRNLEQFPKLTSKTLMNGTFTDNFEKYMSDQIIFKDALVRIKCTENRLLNQTLINGVYFSDNNMLIQKYDIPYNQLDKNISYINSFAENNPQLNCTMLIAPNSSYIYEDYLPSYAYSYDQGEVLAYLHANLSDNVKLADCSNNLMEHRNDYLYYKTDHHWTINGAYLGYISLCDALGITATPKDNYEIVTASDSFYGTLYSKAPTFTQEKDSIILYNNPKGEYKVEFTDTGIVTDSLYNYESLKIKDKYTTYLDGNHPYVTIKSNAPSCDEEECSHKIIVVKDSYAHCLLPLLADNYSEIIVLDMRYFHSSVSKLAEQEGITDIVFIHNLDFISTDNNFLWLK